MSTLTINVGETITNDFEVPATHQAIFPAFNFSLHSNKAYTILEKMREGKSSTLYRVICQSGRLRNRQLALKQVCRDLP